MTTNNIADKIERLNRHHYKRKAREIEADCEAKLLLLGWRASGHKGYYYHLAGTYSPVWQADSWTELWGRLKADGKLP